MIKEVFATGKRMKVRTRAAVLVKLVEEVGELSKEVGAVEGLTYKKVGSDGVMGEAIDVIICALDIIKIDNPDVTTKEINNILKQKLEKWERNEKK